ncbi:peptidylprolyl isomerase [Streptomyces gardneri]|uniref:peptidylprolyl isomerase n=1 Tax=Streptomyces gardneri TaxID=66892 RepID=UPI0006BC7220|nr:peptidylprolyl isomerase [Streptomyces gardneri]ALO07098.1 Peptidyl-prolyl cis-trans isomerase [Streptomyces venezuelae]QPK44456.1 peptidylprolyl isomerase [Streptomyces gardneri]WRK35753.1 peptidylprolyl isomerase [Streptomyces venezuelae]CUM42595.1 Probable peptidyl-prolyl cis-trans isomerase B (PPIase B) (Rotamase B) [Streptomyces venezuelae]
MVTSDQRRRQLAREKYARQQERREERRRKAKQRNIVVAASLAVVLAAGGAVYASVALTDDKKGSDAAAGDTPTTAAPTPSQSESAAPEPKMAVDAKASYTMSLKTNEGVVAIAMDAAKTPRTVNSFHHLAAKKYFDGSKCHRLTTDGIFVLQCGDPTGQGTGGPGYNIPDENLDALGKAGADGKVTYPAGTVAMANTGQPGTGGSQFFLVYKDSKLPPSYTPFGKMDAAGLQAVKDVAAAGGVDGASDGAPKKPVTIEKATVAKK